MIQKFGPLGASVSVDDGAAFGLVLQSEIALLREKRGSDVLLGEAIPAFVEKVRDDNRLNIAFRPVGVPRMKDTAQQLLEALEGSPSMSIPIGDKSPPEDISAYLYGVTKSDFKKAVGLLYKQGVVKPGPHSTELVPEEQRASPAAAAEPFWAKVAAPAPAKITVPATPLPSPNRITSSMDKKPKIAADRSSGASLSERLNSQRGELSKTLFVGNIVVSSCTEGELMAAFGSRIDVSRIKPPLRIALNQDGQPRGFCYVEFQDEQDVEMAMEKLRGLKIKDRVVRLDYADPSVSKKDKEGASAQSGSGRGTVAELLGLGGSPGKAGPADRARREEPLAPAAATLFVGNLSYKAGVEEITAFLEAKAGAGSVRSVRLATDPGTGRKKGFAFVDFFEEDKAKLCFYELHDQELLGRPVLIDDATRRS